MPRVSTMLAVSVGFTFVTVLSWAGVTCAPMHTRLMAFCLGVAVAGTPTCALFWLARWLQGGAMGYVLDAMLTQRARHHHETRAEPLRAVQ